MAGASVHSHLHTLASSLWRYADVTVGSRSCDPLLPLTQLSAVREAPPGAASCPHHAHGCVFLENDRNYASGHLRTCRVGLHRSNDERGRCEPAHTWLQAQHVGVWAHVQKLTKRQSHEGPSGSQPSCASRMAAVSGLEERELPRGLHSLLSCSPRAHAWLCRVPRVEGTGTRCRGCGEQLSSQHQTGGVMEATSHVDPTPCATSV